MDARLRACDDRLVSTDVDAPPTADGTLPGTRRSGRYVALALVLVVALGGLFALHRLGAFGSSGAAGSDGAAGFQAQLSAKLINLLERMPAEQHGHDHGGTTGDARTVCGVRVFGFNPPGATRVDQVAQAYAYHMCAVVQPGVDWLLSVKLTGPAVITLAADPPTVTVVEGGEHFRERVQALFPAEHHNEAFKESLTAEGMQELIKRYDQAA